MVRPISGICEHLCSKYPSFTCFCLLDSQNDSVFGHIDTLLAKIPANQAFALFCAGILRIISPIYPVFEIEIPGFGNETFQIGKATGILAGRCYIYPRASLHNLVQKS